MPVQYRGILEEHRAVRERAGLFDLSHMGELFVEGPEAGAALAFALVTDPPALADGRAHYSMIVAPNGGILDDLIVYRLGRGPVPRRRQRGNAQIVSDLLAERIEAFKAVLDDRSLVTALVAIQGPRSVDIVRPLTDVDLDALRYYAIAEGTVAGIPALVARTGYTGEDGFEVFVDTGRAGGAVGRADGRRQGRRHAPIGLGARDTLRLEAGMPLYGNELDRATNPFEAGSRPRREARQAGRLRGPGGARDASPATASSGRSSGSSCAAAGSPVTATRSWPATARRASSRAAPSRRPSASRSRWATSQRPTPSRVR